MRIDSRRGRPLKRALSLLLSLCLLGRGAAAFAAREASARGEGLEISSETAFEWHGLSLLSETQNEALKALAEALTVRARAQHAAGDGYRALDLSLDGLSVADMAIMARGGTLYEESSLSGGVATAFTKAEFAAFSAALAERSGAFSPNLSLLFDAMLTWLGGEGAPPAAADTLSAAYEALQTWRASAADGLLTRGPRVYLPGVYGATARTDEITREELLALAQALRPLLGPAPDVTPAPGANAVFTALLGLTRAAARLPETLAEVLPEAAPPFFYREIYGPDGAPVCRQIEGAIEGGWRLAAEWRDAPESGALYIDCQTPAGAFSLLATVSGQGEARRTVAEAQAAWNEAEWTLSVSGRHEAEQGEDGETTRDHTAFTFESDALLGAEQAVTLTVDSASDASGTGLRYARGTETVFRLGGLVYPAERILTAQTLVTAKEATPPIDPQTAARPGLLTPDALDAWLTAVQDGAAQAWFTALGRLPTQTAAYLLEIF